MPALTRLTRSEDSLPPLLTLSAAFLLGVLWAGVPPEARIAGAPLVAALLWLIGRDWLALLLALAFAGGLARGVAMAPPELEPPDLLTASRPIEFRGVVGDYPDPTYLGERYVVDLHSADHMPARGRILIQPATLDPRFYGDLISFKARLRPVQEVEPTGWREYLIRQGIAATAVVGGTRREEAGRGDWYRQDLADLRAQLSDAIRRSVPYPESQLALGLTVGDRGIYSSDLQRALRNSGLSHVVVVSGFNTMLIISAVTFTVMMLIGRLAAFGPVLVFAVAYAILTGLEPPVIRAALVALLLLFGGWLGRPVHYPTVLAFAAALMVLYDPRLLGDLSFLLTYSATAALMLLMNSSPGVIVMPRLREVVPATVVASVATAPILLSAFGTISLVAPLSNILVVPFVWIATLGSATVADVGVVHAEAAGLLAIPVTLILRWFVFVAERMASLSIATLMLPNWRPEWTWLIYGCLALLSWRRIRW